VLSYLLHTLEHLPGSHKLPIPHYNRGRLDMVFPLVGHCRIYKRWYSLDEEIVVPLQEGSLEFDQRINQQWPQKTGILIPFPSYFQSQTCDLKPVLNNIKVNKVFITFAN